MPDFNEEPSTPEEKDIHSRYLKVCHSVFFFFFFFITLEPRVE